MLVCLEESNTVAFFWYRESRKAASRSRFFSSRSSFSYQLEKGVGASVGDDDDGNDEEDEEEESVRAAVDERLAHLLAALSRERYGERLDAPLFIIFGRAYLVMKQ